MRKIPERNSYSGMAVTFAAVSGVPAGIGLAQMTKTASGKCHLCQTHY
ncbi:MAG: hypothetical protein ACYS18_11735 [Planctomycetota bacterium]